MKKPRKELKCTRVTRDLRATTINLCQSCLPSRKSKSYKLKEADLIQRHQFAFVKESSTSYNCIDQNSRFMEIGYGQTGKGLYVLSFSCILRDCSRYSSGQTASIRCTRHSCGVDEDYLSDITQFLSCCGCDSSNRRLSRGQYFDRPFLTFK